MLVCNGRSNRHWYVSSIPLIHSCWINCCFIHWIRIKTRNFWLSSVKWGKLHFLFCVIFLFLLTDKLDWVQLIKNIAVCITLTFNVHLLQRQLTATSSFSSASPFSESSQLASSSKPAPYLPRNQMGRRSFMSKPVYPLVFRNPVSETEASRMPEVTNAGRATPSDDSQASPLWRRSLASPELKFHNALSELGKMEASPEPNTSSRREGFRWSNASSYDFGYDGDAIDISDHISIESQHSPANSMRFLKCGLCERFLRQKSPWTSNRIVRNTDMPVAAVLPCRHVFHADCLEESTPKTELHEPPCPLCTRTADDEGHVSFSEPLHVALRSARRNLSLGGGAGGSSSSSANHPSDHGLKRNHSAIVPRRSGSSLFRNHFKKQFPFKARIGKDLFGGRVFNKVGSSSSSGQDDHGQPAAKRTTHQ